MRGCYHKIWEFNSLFAKLFFLQLWIVFSESLSDYPQIISLPENYIYASSVHDPVSFNVVMSPSNAKFLLLVRSTESSHSLRYEFQTLYNSSKDMSTFSSSSIEPVVITVTSHINRNLNHLSVNITLTEWIRLLTLPIHIRIISEFGSIISPPIKIQFYQLSEFDENEDEKVEFLMGNIAQIICRLPVSKPSPPKIKFQHNSNLINISNSSRYKIVEFPPLYHKVALLIRNLLEDDSGKYNCIAYLPNTNFYQISKKITYLTVKKPTQNIPIHFLLSSHFNTDDSKVIDVRIPDGTFLVLYCIFESAPIDEVNWYWSKTDRKYELNQQFGTLTISNASLRDNSDISCMNNEDKIFRIHVYQKPRLIAKPAKFEILKEDLNKTLIIKCEHNQKDVEKFRVIWLFNGVSLYNNQEFQITNNSLIIKSLSRKVEGIYQCWSEIKNEWLSDRSVIFMPHIKPNILPYYSQKTIKVDPGSSVNLHCQIPISYDFHNTFVEWSMDPLNKPILNFNNKFIKTEDFENNQFVLKIKSPRAHIDNGNYTCKIFLKEDQKILVRKIDFRLKYKKIDKQNQSPENPETVQEAFTFFTISKPNVTLPELFLLAVNIEWSLKISFPNMNQSKIVNHYRVEYKQGNPKFRPVRWRSAEPIIDWGNATIIDKSFTKPNCMIHNPQILKPRYWYSFRAVGIPDIKYVQLKFPKKSELFSRNFFDKIRSPWSDPVNFEHIMSTRPKIINVTALSSTGAQISWIYDYLDDNFNYKFKMNIEFKILYKSLPSDIRIESLRPMNEQIYDLLYSSDFINNDIFTEKIESVTKISPYNNDLHELNLTNLKPNIQYIIALYAVHRPINGMSKIYTALSDPYIMDTISYDNKNRKHENNFPTNSKNQTVTHSNYFRNKILFLVLGSMAGILFVIALFMFIMCLWYQIRYHNKKRQNISSASSVKTSSATTFAPIGSINQIQNNSVFIASSNIVSPQGLSPWNKANRFHPPSEFPHLYLAQHLSLWSPNHLAQFNLPNTVQDQILDETKIKKPSTSPTILSTPSPKSNIDLEINNLDGSIEDSQEESVRLLDYQSHSSGFKREDQCTLNNAFSVKSEGRDRQNDNDANSENTRSISHYPFSPSALELYSNKKKTKVCSSNRKDLANIKIHLKQPKLQNSNYFLPIRSRLSCFFPSAPSGESPPPCTPVIPSLCKDNSLSPYNRMKKDETFAEHPFLTTDQIKNGFLNNYGNGSFKHQYSPTNYCNSQKPPSKFIFDPIHDLQPHEDSQSNSTAASARQFLFSLYPDGVRPCINLDLDKQGSNSQTNL